MSECGLGIGPILDVLSRAPGTDGEQPLSGEVDVDANLKAQPTTLDSTTISCVMIGSQQTKAIMSSCLRPCWPWFASTYCVTTRLPFFPAGSSRVHVTLDPA
jgi:hypothetical protein